MLHTVLLSLHTILAFALIALVLIQKSRGADMMTPGGASQTLFGSQGSGSFITRLTAVIAFLFFAINLSFHVLSARQTRTTAMLLAAAANGSPAQSAAQHHAS